MYWPAIITITRPSKFSLILICNTVDNGKVRYPIRNKVTGWIFVMNRTIKGT